MPRYPARCLPAALGSARVQMLSHTQATGPSVSAEQQRENMLCAANSRDDRTDARGFGMSSQAVRMRVAPSLAFALATSAGVMEL